MDAVYLVGPGRGDVLRWSLRSLVNLPQVTRVVVVGHLPAWVTNVTYIPVEQQQTKHDSTFANLRAAIAQSAISDRFLLMNDDFITLRPVEQVPVFHRGPMVDQLDRDERTGNKLLAERRRQLMDMLSALGVEQPVCYELHIPLPVERGKLATVLDRAAEVRPDGMQPTGKRTLYGNLAKIGGVDVADVKLRGRNDPLPDGPFVSTCSTSWGGAAGKAIKGLFPEPCQYERGP